MKVTIAGLTNVGQVREGNEDNFYIAKTLPLGFVADGMGGHSSGEVASALAVATIEAFYESSLVDSEVEKELREKLEWPYQREPDREEERRLVLAVMTANDIIFAQAEANPAFEGMGTTLVGAHFVKTGLFLIHVGDSRAYRLRNNLFERITGDHSLADEYYQLGIMTAAELQIFPYKNVITRALGLADAVLPEVQFLTYQRNDLYLFCSDGLSDMLTDKQIHKILNENLGDQNASCKALVDAANHAGGVDNITVMLSKIESEG